MRRFLLFFRQFQNLLATSNTCISVNIAQKIKCYILKSKLIICEYNGFYFSELTFIGFTLHEIKEGIVFFGTPGIYLRYTIARVRIRASTRTRTRVRSRARTRVRTRVKDSIKKCENTGNCHYPTFLFHKTLRTEAKCSTTSKLNTSRFDNYANHLA